MFIRQLVKAKMAPLKIHNGGSYALMVYLTCWKFAICHAVMASCFKIGMERLYYLSVMAAVSPK